MTKQINGSEVASRIRHSIAEAVAELPVAPTLAVVLVGEDAASHVYVRNKVKQTELTGMRSIERRLGASTTQDELEAVLEALDSDDEVDGILLQLPLPDHLDSDIAIECISAEKDVDGLTESNAGRLAQGKSGIFPCTPVGSVILAKEGLGPDLTGCHVVIVGRSILVGKPAAQLFLQENCTVSIAHSRTRDLAGLCRSADILVAAVGRPEMIKGDWVKPGAVVIDVGINRVAAPEKGPGGTKLTGDVDFDSAVHAASAITPVPGGWGP